MKRFYPLLCSFLLFGAASTAWSKSKSAEFPRYEPPNLDDLPAGVPQASTGKPPAPSEAPPADAPAVDIDRPAAAVPSGEAPPAPVAEIAPTAVAPSVEAVASTPVTPPAKERYKVWIWQENGDCLWRIAEKVYGDRSKWKLIYLANKDVIKDPNKIYPKQKLKIPPSDWNP